MERSSNQTMSITKSKSSLSKIDYYDRPECSNSDLSWLKAQSDTSDGQIDPYEAYRMGTLLDVFITEPEKYDPINMRIGQYQYEEKDIIKVRKMVKSFFSDKFCFNLYQHSSPQSIYTKDVELEFEGIKFSLPMRCKYDLDAKLMKMGGDIKSTTATTQEQFEAACEFFDYDRQRAVYMTLSGYERDCIIGISKKNFKVFKVFIKRGDPLFEKGMEEFRMLAYKYWTLFG